MADETTTPPEQMAEEQEVTEQEATQSIEELTQEIENLIASFPSSEEEDVNSETTSVTGSGKGDLSKAVKEKNKIISKQNQLIKELKANLAEYHQKLSQPAEGETQTPNSDEGNSQKTQPVEGEKQDNTQSAEGEKQSETADYEEVTKIVSAIEDKCNELAEKYPDFDKFQVLSRVYDKTGGSVMDLDIIEDMYLAMKAKKETEVNENKKTFSSLTNSPAVSGGYKPKDVREAFAIIKKQK
jgi:hypothetical protein